MSPFAFPVLQAWQVIGGGDICKAGKGTGLARLAASRSHAGLRCPSANVLQHAPQAGALADDREGIHPAITN